MGKLVKNLIFKSAYELVAEGGFAALSTQKVALKSNMTKGNLYNYFKDKTSLINESYKEIERELSEIAESIPDDNNLSNAEILKNSWSMFFAYFVENPDKANYYVNFRRIPAYSSQLAQFEEPYINAFSKKFGSLMEIDPSVKEAAIEYLLNGTVKLACDIVEGKLIVSDNTTNYVYELLFSGFNTIIK